MYCKRCGAEIKDDAKFCPNCGANQTVDSNTSYDSYDSGSVGWAILGFFIPIVGLVLFLVWNSTKPLTAKKAGLGALISIIVSFVLSILLGVLSALIA